MAGKQITLSPDEVREITIRKPKLTQKEQVFLYMCEHGSIEN